MLRASGCTPWLSAGLWPESHLLVILRSPLPHGQNSTSPNKLDFDTLADMEWRKGQWPSEVWLVQASPRRGSMLRASVCTPWLSAGQWPESHPLVMLRSPHPHGKNSTSPRKLDFATQADKAMRAKRPWTKVTTRGSWVAHLSSIVSEATGSHDTIWPSCDQAAPRVRSGTNGMEGNSVIARFGFMMENLRIGEASHPGPEEAEVARAPCDRCGHRPGRRTMCPQCYYRVGPCC